MEILGWIGALLLAICALPLTLDALIRKKAEVQGVFLLLWFFGEVLMLLHCLTLGDTALIVNYAANILLLLPVLAVKFRRKK